MPRLSFAAITACVVMAGLAACSSDPRLNRPRPVFSPNGEMLAAARKDAPACPEALGAWWDRLAAEHGGEISRDTFLADAEAQFAAMDLDHDGFVTPSELSEYRAGREEPYYAETPPPGAPRQERAAPPVTDRRGGQYSHVDDVQARAADRASQIPADIPDPVMSADRSLSFKVSHEDFMVHQRDVFAEFDKKREGKLTREALVASCTVK